MQYKTKRKHGLEKYEKAHKLAPPIEESRWKGKTVSKAIRVTRWQRNKNRDSKETFLGQRAAMKKVKEQDA